MGSTLVALSNELAAAVERAGRSVVTVNARQRISASGIHWRPGIIVTADHAIKRDEDIRVTLPDGRSVTASLAGRDPGTDLAVLKIEEPAAPAAEFSPAESLRAGRMVLAVGRSAETGINATMGVISAVSGPWRTFRGGLIDAFVRLDVALYPGASGGAVVDVEGRVLGMATSALSRIAAVAIPAATVDRVAEKLLTRGYIARGYLGVGLQPIASGVIVLSVEPDGPAEHAGMLVGDILVAMDGKPVKDTDDVQTALEAEAIGKPLKVSAVRGGKPAELTVTVGERPRRE